METPHPGEAVVITNVSGTYEDGKATKGTAALTTTIGPPVEDSEFDDLAVDGVNKSLGLAGEHKNKLDKLFAQHLSRQLTAATNQQKTMAQELGLPSDFGSFFQQQLDSELAFWEGIGEGFAERVDEQGKAGGQFLANAYATLEDPVSRQQLAETLASSVKPLAKSALENLGYLGQAYLAAKTPEGIRTYVDANLKLGADITESLGHAYQGAKELLPQEAREYERDPVAYNRKLGRMGGRAGADGVKEAMFAAIGEVGVAGIAKYAPRALERIGLTRRAAAPAEVEVAMSPGALAESELLAGADEAAAMARRLDLAEQTARTFQDLEYGALLDDATLFSQAGIRTEDAAEIRSIIKDANDKFGIDLGIGARTSEALSVGLDGVAKREFLKPKAVSTLDKLLGAEESLAGRASVFDAQMPTPEVLRGLETRYPGITQKLDTRLADQAKLWKEYKDPNSALSTIIKGSEKAEDGITVIVERPGYTLAKDAPELAKKIDGEPPFAYLEQLNDPAFLDVRKISPDRAKELKATLSKYPDSGRTRILTEKKNGTVTFIEGLLGKPIISDLDLQFVAPKGGWPPGKRGQIEAYVNARMKKIGRFPKHGWSDSALDVPSEYAEVAAKFRLNTAHPAVAPAVADEFARRFGVMGRLLREKAAGVTDPVLKKALIDKAEKYEALTAAELLRKYPPGEKIIVFTQGDVRVGASTGVGR
ncbi:MAG TPA: hypothetical protein VF230_16810, partial [Acidimicrobiales bacterium]